MVYNLIGPRNLKSNNKSLCIFALTTFIVTIILNNYLLNHKQRINDHFESMHVPPSWFLSVKAIAADWYWLCLLTKSTQDFKPIFTLAMRITDLDPHFNIVYRYAAVQLMQSKHFDKAQQLLAKALRSPTNQADWRIYFYHGLCCLRCNDRTTAAQSFQAARACELTNCAPCISYAGKIPEYIGYFVQYYKDPKCSLNMK